MEGARHGCCPHRLNSPTCILAGTKHEILPHVSITSSTVRADGGQATVTWPGAQDSTAWGLMRGGDPEQSPAPGPGSGLPVGTRSHFLAFPTHQGSCKVRHANMLRQHPEVQLSQFPPGSGIQLLEHNKPQQLQSIFPQIGTRSPPRACTRHWGQGTGVPHTARVATGPQGGPQPPWAGCLHQPNGRGSPSAGQGLL